MSFKAFPACLPLYLDRQPVESNGACAEGV